jgi:hypothetical protein
VDNRNEIRINVTLAFQYRRDSMSQIFRKFPLMNSNTAIIKEIEDAMSKTPETFSEEQFKYNKNIPTIIMAQKISEQISAFNVQLV